MLSPRVPELSALQMLCTVRRLGSFSAAGKALGLSQQAVSSRMRSLEDLIGTPLLLRSPRGSTLTAHGTLLADLADGVLTAAATLDAGIAAVRHETARELHVVASQTVAEHVLPPWLVVLRREQEAAGSTPTTIRLEVTNSTVAAALVRSGAVTVGFIETPNLPDGLAHRTVTHDELVVVVAPDHPWARRRHPLTADELARTPLVTRETGSGTRDALESVLATQAPASPVTPPLLELTTSAAVRSAISARTAPGVLSRHAVHDDLALGRLVAVPTPGLSLGRPITAIWQSGAHPPAGPARDLVAIAARSTTTESPSVHERTARDRAESRRRR